MHPHRSTQLAIIGAGSSYTPELIEGLARSRQTIPLDKVILMDQNPQRLEKVAGFCQRFLRAMDYDLPLEATTDLRTAIQDASFIITQIRIGGNAQRILDEKIPLKYGVIGQETTGPGGMLNAFRTIPVMLDILGEVERTNPSAWVINYTNPTGMVAEAAYKHTRTRFTALCSGGLFPAWKVSQALGVPAEDVHYRYFGLNHLNFAWDFRVKNHPLTDEAFDRVAEIAAGETVDLELLKSLRMIPSPYLGYFYHHQERVAAYRQKPTSRGEDILELEDEIFAAYADPAQTSKPAALARRGGGGYSEVALGVIEALLTDQPKEIIINVPNRGISRFLPEDAVIEVPCLVNGGGIFPLAQPDIPPMIWGLVAAVKNYEQLAVEAAITGSRQQALFALLAHPLVGNYDLANRLLDEMLDANRSYLPQFFPQG